LPNKVYHATVESCTQMVQLHSRQCMGRKHMELNSWGSLRVRSTLLASSYQNALLPKR